MQSMPAKSLPVSEKPSNFWKTISRVLLRSQSFFGLIGILILSAALSPVRNGHNVFLGPENLLNIVRFASENGIIAIGMTLVIIIGGIDLSGSGTGTKRGSSAAFLMRYGWDTVPTIVVILALGTFVGLLNGTIVTKVNLQAFIVTLATLSAARGVASLWSGGYPFRWHLVPGQG